MKSQIPEPELEDQQDDTRPDDGADDLESSPEVDDGDLDDPNAEEIDDDHLYAFILDEDGEPLPEYGDFWFPD